MSETDVRRYLRAVALAAGHPPERVDRMTVRDLALIDAVLNPYG